MQDSFAQALLNPLKPVPDNITGSDPLERQKRFSVYRNNVQSSLLDAMKQSFPVLCELIGDSAFESLTLDYIRQYPPISPCLFEYGEELSAYLCDCEALVDYPYLPDVARLEFGLMRSAHAADAEPISQVTLGALAADPDRLYRSVVEFAPSVQLITSSFAVGSLWQIHQLTDPTERQRALKQLDISAGERLFLSRPLYSLRFDRLSEDQAQLISALMQGAMLGDVLKDTQEEHSGWLFELLIRRSAIIGVHDG